MTVRLAALALLLSVLIPAWVLAEEPQQWARDNLDSLIAFYQKLHQAPELSLHEEKTAATMADALRAVGAKVTTGIGGHGVIGILENGPGPKLMLRTDLDALPVTEKTGLAYASRVKVTDDSGAEVGVMHACGHDIHMTNLIGVARYLAANKDRWRGTVMFLCQPAEERGLGAKRMIDDGCFDRFFKPEFSLALHCDSTLPTGTIGWMPGRMLANVDSVDITVRGRGGHGAHPDTTVDPIVQAAQLILDLQTIVGREIKPTDPAVVTVGSIHGGSKHNIIGDSCHLQLTVRSISDETRKHILDAIERKAKAVAASYRAPEPTIVVSDSTPALHNDEKLVAKVLPALQKAVGPEKVVPTELSMGGEDYSQYGLAGVPVFMFRLGTVDPRRMETFQRTGQSPPSLHSPVFYPDADQALVTGITATAAAVMELLPAKKP